ncbi:MAG: flagellar hook assembly protein FlgD [Spirochaetes bacterium]|jgi:flagellar basal-body rod modification protein FlgD|nr:flagellar hook assembly protein FlgD [Spirochaetota bacterium]
MKIEMSAADKSKAAVQADESNKKLGKRGVNQGGNLGKEAFLKLLITELKHQDPTRPMEDKEFISQMAQFSSLEQMTNINKEMESMLKSTRSTEAFSLLGKRIEAFNPSTNIKTAGVVTSVINKEGDIRLKVGETEVSLVDVHAVYSTENRKKANREVQPVAGPEKYMEHSTRINSSFISEK